MKKSKWKLSKRSSDRMHNLHPKLVRVTKRALELSPYDFGVGEVERTLERQKQLLADGDTWTLKSLHLVQEDGYVHALDIVVYKKGKVTWSQGVFRKVMQAFVTAAIEEGVQIELGGLWESVFDGPHCQLHQGYLDEEL